MNVLTDHFRCSDLEVLPATLVAVRTLTKGEVAALLKTSDLVTAIEDQQVAKRVTEVFGVPCPTVQPGRRSRHGDVLFLIEPRKTAEADGFTVFEIAV